MKEKKFNITGTCIPEKHYMVNVENKVKKVAELVEEGLYFVISRPRQFGKTTLLYLLEKEINDNYLVISISFEGLGEEAFLSPEALSTSFIQQILKVLRNKNKTVLIQFINEYKKINNLNDLGIFISDFVNESQEKIVLIIDEVDRASNFNLFISFLGLLRDKYLKRNSGSDVTFHSVILAGLHDIKNIKLKMRPDSKDGQPSVPTYNSPWNIATEFGVDMSFSPEEIETMLEDYYQTQSEKRRAEKEDIQSQRLISTETKSQLLISNTQYLSREIYKYTNGYPFLVSKICKVIEEDLDRNWTVDGIQKAVLKILKEQNTLFDDLVKNLEQNEELSTVLNAILLEGIEVNYNAYNPILNKGINYGFFRSNEQEKVVIANKIFEIHLYNYLASKFETSSLVTPKYNFRDNFIDSNGDLEIEKVLLKFQQFIKENYSDKDDSFYEKHGRLLLIAFVKPILNGNGFYYVESQTSYERRRDMVITFNKKEFILEFKLWQGIEYHQKGLQQLARYLETRDLPIGYLVVFNFNKNKEFTSEWKTVDDKNIFGVFV